MMIIQIFTVQLAQHIDEDTTLSPVYDSFCAWVKLPKWHGEGRGVQSSGEAKS